MSSFMAANQNARVLQIYGRPPYCKYAKNEYKNNKLYTSNFWFLLRGILTAILLYVQGYSPLGSPGTEWLKSDVLKHPILTSVAEKLGKTPAQVALRWGLQMGHSVLPKSTNEARIKENFDVFNWSIPDDLLAEFSKLNRQAVFYSYLI